MNKEFTNNVQKLFHQVVPTPVASVSAEGHTAHDLLNILLCKVTQPLRHYWENCHLHLVYYNVSLDIASDLSSFKVSYTPDFTVSFTDLQHCDTYQLAEFVLALERDIPQWRHIWLAAEELRKKKFKMAEHLQFALSNLHHDWMKSNSHDLTSNTHYRLRYYNIKASQLMLEHDNPFWKNKKTEAEILDECNLYHVDAPLEQWFEDWTHFAHNCEEQKIERDRKRQEHQDKLMKMCHLINIKRLKLEALLKTIELHDAISVTVENIFDFQKLDTIRYGHYLIRLTIDNADTYFNIKYDQIDTCLMKTVEYLKRINDIVPALHATIREDGDGYRLESIYHYYGDPDEETFYSASYSRLGFNKIDEKLSSYPVIKRLNTLCKDLRKYIISAA